ncbi:MAG: 50S ribosomal protein L9 [Micrococcales bacterium]|nr:50S ribosomal protein L9 [Micrococcales bacterium]NBR60952.1 50S ribosomal protein L9 [Actinomycetota bacterium]NBT46756.1 50S ribosomal protein L9 [Actinomycetota bacterium]NBY43660.1 50S ribosomal protein L9 [Micrococcales bacterium]NDE88740.1 50S ribosomal protein L9 [Micrococcales bacterium]
MSKVILTNEVSGLGSAGDVVEVKNGYARNYLLPRGFAVLWTKGGEKQVTQIKAAREARALATIEEAQAMRDRLQANPIKLSVKAGVGGRLFGAVKTADVAAAVAAAGLGEIDKRKVAFFAPIRSTGNFEATVKLRSDLTATLKLQVVAKK